MLDHAFVKTSDFELLSKSLDINFVVGRRGSGKSALFLHLREHYESKKHEWIVVAETPQEASASAFYSLLHRLGLDYRRSRHISRQLWRFYLLLRVSERLLALTGADDGALKKWHDSVSHLQHGTSLEVAWRVLDQYAGTSNPAEIAMRMIQDLGLDRAEQIVQGALTKVRRPAIIIIDRLDEGWNPDVASAAAIGGLTSLAASWQDARRGVHVLLFARDNMFRALSHLDGDFSRDVDGATLRLRWDQDALLHMVAERVRIALEIPGIENDAKVWSRFAKGDLGGRDGFRLCLRHTLYRPRDVLTLLNGAWATAQRAGRDAIVRDDILGSATRISEERRLDLEKEYEVVFPGLKHVVDLFIAAPAVMTHGHVVSMLSAAETDDVSAQRTGSDFALLNDASSRFAALYGVGFLGVLNSHTGNYVFCHDGLPSGGASLESSQSVAIHPAYWRALRVSAAEEDGALLVHVGDDYNEVADSSKLMDLRVKMIGQITTSLQGVRAGKDGEEAFEEWVLRAFQVLFSGSISNLSLKSSGAAERRRDVVGTIVAERGFWSRVRSDYGTRQLVIEINNYEHPDPDDFRQLSGQLGREYGRFGMLVARREEEALSPSERDHARAAYTGTTSQVLLMITSKMLEVWLRKMRSPERFDYAEKHLQRRLDTYLRSYVVNRPSR